MATDVGRTRGTSYGARPSATETKPFFLTSEFGVLVLMTPRALHRERRRR